MMHAWVGGAALLTALLAWPLVVGQRSTGPPVMTVVVTHPGGTADIGTGFAAGGDRVVTVAHLLRSGGAVTVRSGAGRARRARVLRIDARQDLAVLVVPGQSTAPVRLATDAHRVRVMVRRAADIRSLPGVLRRRIVARVRDPVTTSVHRRAALELGAEVEIGDSGAPVVTDGRLVGVLFARSRIRPRTAYAVDAAGIAELIGR